MGIVAHVLSGKEIGSVSAGAGVPPIVASFRREAERSRLDIQDSLKRRVTLEIYRKPQHRRTSRFLYSLSFLRVPFAALAAGPDFVRGTGLERIHEHWQYSWSPMTEGGLVEAAIYGATVEEAAINRLREAIARLDEEGKGRSAQVAVPSTTTPLCLSFPRPLSFPCFGDSPAARSVSCLFRQAALG